MWQTILILATLLTALPVDEVSQPVDRPNILLIISEDSGPELGCYGDCYARTPNLDRLAASGVRFVSAYVTQAGCSQSRASILTGLYPHQHGQIGLATWGFRMYREDTPNLPHSLKAAGYRTGRIGKLHINPETAFPYDMHEISSGNFARKNLGDYARHAEAFFRADFLRGKRTSYEGGVRIPLIIRWPRGARPAQVREELISTIDLMPTLLAVARAEPVANLPDRSLLPLLSGETTEWRQYLFTEYHTHAAQQNFYPQRTVRDDRYKLIENLMPGGTNPGYDFTNDRIDGVTQAIEAAPPEVRAAYRRMQTPPRFELYDLQADPFEFHNLAYSPERAAIFGELKQHLATWREQTQDPLLNPANLQRLKAEVYSVKKKAEGKALDWGYPDYFSGREPVRQTDAEPAWKEGKERQAR